jgi:hypothetical protein
MKILMLHKGWNTIFVVALLVSSAACSKSIVQRDDSVKPPAPAFSGTTNDRRVLAGEWEYEDGAAVTLRLDEQGNGTYAWKEGRFETTALTDHTWHGMWFQKENDREGGFTVEFSPDFSEGEGRWWYSRIGSDHTPSQQGGTFHLMRKMSHANAGNTPPAP